EKTKYLFSDLYWKNLEDEYRFSLQFTADMIAMNKSNFIITSTYQEIAGTETSMGQYESYQHFTMPGLYQVVSGVNLFHPKFNVIPPGVDESNYYPYYEKEKRVSVKSSELENMLFKLESNDIFGKFDDVSKPPIFTMARLDKIKNITGLAEAFGRSKKLQHNFNLIVVAGSIDPDRSKDREEQEEIKKLYHLIEHYKLKGRIRWLPSISKADTGEVYRIIADYGGIFVQPALFEAFGLTILEAMLSGLPTFGPVFGGPSEIIEDKTSGYLMNTTNPVLMSQVLECFVDECKKAPSRWKQISDNGIKRVRDTFTWNNYSKRLFSLTKIYSFWRYSVSNKGKVKMSRYCDLLYYLLFKQRADSIKN
ncbi:MAG: glycosyltransferase, partial [Oligoflexia bacterium]|nr:glycosyltransferase [Oligoflexia bacterium]